MKIAFIIISISTIFIYIGLIKSLLDAQKIIRTSSNKIIADSEKSINEIINENEKLKKEIHDIIHGEE